MVADDELDNFMPTFKYYKQRLNPPSFENVIDFASQNCKHPYSFIDPPENKQNLGLKCDKQWKLFQVKDVPGLFVIPNPFTDDGQVKWASRCLGSYACQPNKTNLDAFEKQYSSDRSLWDETCEQVGGELKKNGKSSHKKGLLVVFLLVKLNLNCFVNFVFEALKLFLYIFYGYKFKCMKVSLN